MNLGTPHKLYAKPLDFAGAIPYNRLADKSLVDV